MLDIGAHAGQFAKLFARLAPKGRVYAFEPSPYALSILRRALWANGLTSRIQVVPAALSDREGEAELGLPLKPSGSLGFGLAHLGGAPEATNWSVPTRTMDLWIAGEGLARLDFIKIDVEGWELRALAGGRESLARFGPTVMAELDPAFLARAGDTPEALFAFMRELGYHARDLPSGAPAPEFAGAGDYLFVRGR